MAQRPPEARSLFHVINVTVLAHSVSDSGWPSVSLGCFFQSKLTVIPANLNLIIKSALVILTSFSLLRECVLCN
jgi:hypothetical protein